MQPLSLKRRRRARLLIACAAAASVVLLAGAVQAQSDDFNDGNDNGWFRYSPLAPFGVPGVYTFPDGGYRIQTTVATGDEGNPGRAGSINTNVTYTDFYVAIDVVDWKDDTRQAFGVLGRITNPALGQTTGYAFTYERGGDPPTPTSGDLDISRLDGEITTTIEAGPSGYHLEVGKAYRFVLIGKGPALEGRIYELPDTITPKITVMANDATYASGWCGLVIYDNTGGNGVADATFDNYLALPEEPPRLSYLLHRGLLELQVSWPVSFTGYILESSPVLPATTWTEEFVDQDNLNFYHWEGAELGNKFFRLRKP